MILTRQQNHQKHRTKLFKAYKNLKKKIAADHSNPDRRRNQPHIHFVRRVLSPIAPNVKMKCLIKTDMEQRADGGHKVSSLRYIDLVRRIMSSSSFSYLINAISIEFVLPFVVVADDKKAAIMLCVIAHAFCMKTTRAITLLCRLLTAHRLKRTKSVQIFFHI